MVRSKWVAGAAGGWLLATTGLVAYAQTVASWTLIGYVNNVTDSYDYVNVAYNSFLPEVPENLLVIPLAPRTFSAMLSYKF